MMGGLEDVNTRLITCCIILIILLVDPNYAQEGEFFSCLFVGFAVFFGVVFHFFESVLLPMKYSMNELGVYVAGFVSIQCCADAAFIDPNTSISYIPDESWYPDKKSCQNTVWVGDINQESNEARFFQSRYDSKWCYSLPTRSGSVYLIRGTFPLSNLQGTPPDTFFSVSVAQTLVGQVNYVQEQRVEALFTATSNYTNFCLVKGKGEAYIAKVELRPSSQEYLKRYGSSLLKLVDRADVGNRVAEIR